MKRAESPTRIWRRASVLVGARSSRRSGRRKAPTWTQSPTQSILTTLWDQPRWLEAYHLYDQRGSELFEQICDLPEYYLTRTENAILETHASEIIAARTGSLHRRARRRLQQKNRSFTDRATAPTRPEHLRAHRRERRRLTRVARRRSQRDFPEIRISWFARALRGRLQRHRQKLCRPCSSFSAAPSATSITPTFRASFAPFRRRWDRAIFSCSAPTESRT